MALIPSNNKSEADKRAQRASSEQEALLREVDEAVRTDQLSTFASSYGKPIIALLVIALACFGGWLWWTDSHESSLERTSEELVKGVDQLEAGNLDTADSAFATISDDAAIGAQTVATLAQAGIAFRQERMDEAAKLYAAVASDEKAPKPYRDLANIREVAIRYDKMKPEEVVARMKPLATPGTPFFGSAGELLGAAYLDQNKRDLAGPLFAEIAKDENVPETLRSRARQLAGLLGVDAIDDVDATLEQLREEGAPGGAEQ